MTREEFVDVSVSAAADLALLFVGEPGKNKCARRWIKQGKS